jgi:hypothetical protein
MSLSVAVFDRNRGFKAGVVLETRLLAALIADNHPVKCSKVSFLANKSPRSFARCIGCDRFRCDHWRAECLSPFDLKAGQRNRMMALSRLIVLQKS